MIHMKVILFGLHANDSMYSRGGWLFSRPISIKSPLPVEIVNLPESVTSVI